MLIHELIQNLSRSPERGAVVPATKPTVAAMVKSSVAAWMQDLRPSMQDPQSPPLPARRGRRAGGTPCRPAQGPTGLWHHEEVPATPTSLLAVTPPRPSRGDKHKASRAKASAQHAENRPPFNNSPSPGGGRSSSPRSSTETQESLLNDSASSTARALSPLTERRQSRALPARSCSRSRSPLRRVRNSPGRPEQDEGTAALLSHISQLRAALRDAVCKLDTLEKERSALKEQLSGVANDTGAHAARMRVLEKQLQAARREDDGKLSSALIAEQQKNESLRKTLDHRVREVALLTGELKERDGQIEKLRMARDAALDDADQLRGDVIHLKHSLEALQESLRVLEQQNVDLADKHAALEDALQDSEAKKQALVQEVYRIKEESCEDAREGHAVLQLSGWLLPASPRAQPHVDDVLGVDGDLQREPARSNPQQFQSMQSEMVHGVPNHGHAHSHVSNNHLRLLRVSERTRGPLRDGAHEQSGVSAGSTLRHPGCMHAEGEPHQDPYPDLDSPGAGAQYVRREVLELVKLKAKADLVQLETELMAVIQAMEVRHSSDEHRGAAARGHVASHLLTPDLRPALRPQSADSSPSPGAVSEIRQPSASPTTRTTSPPARTKELNTERRQRASGSVTPGGAAGLREGSAHNSPVSLDTERAGGQEAPRSTNFETTWTADDAHQAHSVVVVCHHHQLLLHRQASVCVRRSPLHVAPNGACFPPLVQETKERKTWSRPAASLLTAGWQIAEFQERIEFLEMDKEVLVHEREELCKALSEQSKQIEELSQRRAHEDEARESFEARACALQEEVRDRVLALFSRGSWPAESYFFFLFCFFFVLPFFLCDRPVCPIQCSWMTGLV